MLLLLLPVLFVLPIFAMLIFLHHNVTWERTRMRLSYLQTNSSMTTERRGMWDLSGTYIIIWEKRKEKSRISFKRPQILGNKQFLLHIFTCVYAVHRCCLADVAWQSAKAIRSHVKPLSLLAAISAAAAPQLIGRAPPALALQALCVCCYYHISFSLCSFFTQTRALNQQA